MYIYIIYITLGFPRWGTIALFLHPLWSSGQHLSLRTIGISWGTPAQTSPRGLLMLKRAGTNLIEMADWQTSSTSIDICTYIYIYIVTKKNDFKRFQERLLSLSRSIVLSKSTLMWSDSQTRRRWRFTGQSPGDDKIHSITISLC